MVELKSMVLFVCFISLFPSYDLDFNYTAIFHQPLCFIEEKFFGIFFGFGDNNVIGSIEPYSFAVVPILFWDSRVRCFRYQIRLFGVDVLTPS